MKKTIKKGLIVFTCIAVLINAMSQTALAAESKQQKLDKAIQKLADSGWAEEEIYDVFPEQDLLIISDAVDVINSTKYYMVIENNDSNECEFINMSKKDCLNAVEHEKNDTLSSYAADTETTSDGYFTATITLTSYASGMYLVSYNFKWLTDPYFRNIDAFAAITDNLTLNNVMSKYYIYDNVNGVYHTSYTITPDVKTSTHGVAMEIDLADKPALYHGINTNHRGYVSYSAYKSNSTSTVAAAWGEYYHNELAVSLSPGVSISGVSVSFTLSAIMNEMLPNPYITYNIQ